MALERLDKILALLTDTSRKEVKRFVWAGRVKIDGVSATSPDQKVDREHASVTLDGRALNVRPFLYLLLNKPAGVISATKDKVHQTVLDLVPKDLYRRGLFPAGRLDRDTEGMMILTDDGDFAHKILSPKNHIAKTYHAVVNGAVSPAVIEGFSGGVTLGDGTKCAPAVLQILDEGKNLCEVVITQGVYHQIKRMFAAFGLQVLWLKRVSMGGLALDPALPPGAVRELSEQEIAAVLGKKTDNLP